MKIYHKITILCLLGLMLTAFTTGLHAQDKEKKSTALLLIGSWALDFDKSTLYSDAAYAQRFNSKKNEVKARVRNSFSSRSMVFHTNGTYTFLVSPDKAINGTWALSENGQVILVRFADSRQVQHTIMEISPSKLVFTVGRTNSGARLFNVWGLNKLN